MNDKELIGKILSGSTNAYSEVVKRYSGKVFSRIVCMVKNSDDAQELTQQTFVRAYTRLNLWQGNNLEAWLCSIGIHLTLNSLNKQKRYASQPVEGLNLSDSEVAYNGEKEQSLQLLEQAIAALPANDRLIIRLHYYERKKTSEIAQLLNLSNSNVLVKLHRIREQLKRRIEDEKDKR